MLPYLELSVETSRLKRSTGNLVSASSHDHMRMGGHIAWNRSALCTHPPPAVDLEALLTSCSGFLGPCRQLDQCDGNNGERHYLGIFFYLASDLFWVELDNAGLVHSHSCTVREATRRFPIRACSGLHWRSTGHWQDGKYVVRLCCAHCWWNN